MTELEIYEQVQQIFREVFDDDELSISSETNSDEIDEWDSLNHINLVVAIENEFDIRFVPGELQELKNVGEMITLLGQKRR